MKGLCLLMLLASLFAPLGLGQSSAHEPKTVGRRPADETSHLERWRQMTPEERARFQERFEALRKLSKEERAALRERARELDAERSEIADKLGPDMRDRMRRLPPEERDRILREHQLEEHRRAGQSLRGELDSERAAWVEGLVGADRPRPIHDVRAELRGRIEGRLLDRWGQAGSFAEGARQRLEGLAPHERMQELLIIHRERIVGVVAQQGLPAGVDAEAWTQLQAETEPERFLRGARKLGLDLLAPPPGDPEHGWRPDWKADGPRWERGHSELGGLLFPTFEDRMAVAGAPDVERWGLIEARIAARLRTKLGDTTWMPELDRAPLLGLDDSALLETLRGLQRGRHADGDERGRRAGRGKPDWRGTRGPEGPPPGPPPGLPRGGPR